MKRLNIIFLIVICSVFLNHIDPVFGLPPDYDFQSFIKDYGRMIANLILILMLFIFVVRPLIKAAKEYQESKEKDTSSVVSGFGKFNIQKNNFVSKEEVDEKFDKILSAIHDLSKKIDKMKE